MVYCIVASNPSGVNCVDYVSALVPLPLPSPTPAPKPPIDVFDYKCHNASLFPFLCPGKMSFALFIYDNFVIGDVMCLQL